MALRWVCLHLIPGQLTRSTVDRKWFRSINGASAGTGDPMMRYAKFVPLALRKSVGAVSWVDILLDFSLN
jgi:hypothetical protein